MDTKGTKSLRRAGFTLIELLVVIAILALLVGILLPSLAEAKRLGRKTQCVSDERQFGIAYASYASDFQDRMASFTWRAGEVYADWTGAAATDIQAAADQAVDILRRRAERDTVDPITQIATWIPHVLYSHLVINDYLAQRLPEKTVVCPEDRNRLSWQQAVQDNPANPAAAFEALPNRPAGAGNTVQRWPYSSSYQLIVAAYSPDQRANGLDTISPATENHYTYQVPTTTPYGRRKFSEVQFPSMKVAMFDAFQRHSGKRTLFYAYTDSVQPLLFWDSSVVERRTSDSNPGFRPNAPTSPFPSSFRYEPELSWEPPTRSGAVWDLVKGYYQWTRGGLRGVDFGGGEVDTGQPHLP